MAERKWSSPRLFLSLYGDRERAGRLERKARVLTGYLFDQLRPGQTSRRQMWRLKDGSIIKATVWRDLLGERAVAKIFSPGAKPSRSMAFPFLALVWMPEGIMLTPASVDAPHGYGFPKRDGTTGALINPPFGTLIENAEDSALNQVLINRFENNKYLDRPGFIDGFDPPKFSFPDNPRLRASLEDPLGSVQLAPYVAWTLCFTPVEPGDDFAFDRTFWEADGGKLVDDKLVKYNIEHVDEPGCNAFRATEAGESLPKLRALTAGPVVPIKVTKEGEDYLAEFRQFDGLESVPTETESDEWFTHWPEEILYENAAFEEIFQGSNRLREAAGELPVTRPVRGHANGADRTTVEMSISGKMFHDTDEWYRQGYGTTLSRMLAMQTHTNAMAENLEVNNLGNLASKSVGASVLSGWEHSPGHYANIIYEGWSSPKGATALSLGGGYPISMTESGPPDPEEYDPPVNGYAYAQWFERRDRWVGSGLFVNQTPYGSVSIRSLSTLIYTSFDFSEAYKVFYAGREFLVGQILDILNDPESTAWQIVVGATAFEDDGRLWLRAIAYESGSQYGLYSYIAPIANTGDSLLWKEEAYLSLDRYGPIEITGGFSFTMDGSAGVAVISLLEPGYATFMWPDTPDEPKRVTTALYRATFGAAGFALEKESSVPSIAFTMETALNVDGITTDVMSYEQEVSGELVSQVFYAGENGDELQSLVYVTDMRCYQHKVDDDAFHCHDYIRFPSGKTIGVVEQTTTNGVPSGACYITSFLYLDPRAEDAVYARINLRRDGSTIYGTLSFYYNETLLRTYSEQVMATHYGASDGKIDCSWPVADPPGTAYLSNVYDLGFLRDTDASGRLYPLPYPMSSGAHWECVTDPTISYLPSAICTGEFPVRSGFRFTCGSNCFTGDDSAQDVVLWSYNIGIPATLYSSTSRPELDSAHCEFARYHDRVALDIFFDRVAKMESDDPDGDHIIYTNFDAEKEIGIGELRSLMPLGVV